MSKCAHSSSTSTRVGIELCLCSSGCDASPRFLLLLHQSASRPRPDLFLSFHVAVLLPAAPSVPDSPFRHALSIFRIWLASSAISMDNDLLPPLNFALPGFTTLVELTMASQQVNRGGAIAFLEPRNPLSSTQMLALPPSSQPGLQITPSNGLRHASMFPCGTSPGRACVMLHDWSDRRTKMTPLLWPKQMKDRSPCDWPPP